VQTLLPLSLIQPRVTTLTERNRWDTTLSMQLLLRGKPKEKKKKNKCMNPCKPNCCTINLLLHHEPAAAPCTSMNIAHHQDVGSHYSGKRSPQHRRPPSASEPTLQGSTPAAAVPREQHHLSFVSPLHHLRTKPSKATISTWIHTLPTLNRNTTQLHPWTRKQEQPTRESPTLKHAWHSSPTKTEEWTENMYTHMINNKINLQQTGK